VQLRSFPSCKIFHRPFSVLRSSFFVLRSISACISDFRSFFQHGSPETQVENAKTAMGSQPFSAFSKNQKLFIVILVTLASFLLPSHANLGPKCQPHPELITTKMILQDLAPSLWVRSPTLEGDIRPTSLRSQSIPLPTLASFCRSISRQHLPRRSLVR
jgi:hypothetical protein